MPYNNPEDKRRWEREHRPQRNEIRRRRHLSGTRVTVMTPNSMPDRTAPDPECSGNVMAIGIIVLTVGLLLLVITIWKVRRRRACFTASARPATHEGGSNE
jgi:hypothetical protein